MEKIKYYVFYTKDLSMRERAFDTEKEANEFSETVNGSVAPIKFKEPLTGKAKKEQNRIKKFGYGV